jgi:hypothetical protein
VKLIDVMRGAVAEVEDYARVIVSTQTRAALSGSAVTDLIHLLAELIENATSLSPPFTQVRVGGETVANGFAIEIEDRGLGMVPQRLQELNERLANPPDINPANTEQLGLFVVGQLARRHGVRVMLRPSPYGGTTAVVLIPLALIVEDGPAAITSGGRAPETAGNGNGSHNGNGAYNGNGARNSGGYANGAAGGRPATAPAGVMRPGGNGTAGRPTGYPTTAGRPVPRGLAANPGGYGQGKQDQGPLPVRAAGAPRQPEGTGSFGGAAGYSTGPGTGATPGAAEPGPRRGRHGTDDVPVVTGVPVGRPVTPPPGFDVFTPISRPDQDGPADADAAYPQSYPDFGGQAADPYATPYNPAHDPALQGDGPAYQGGGTYGDNGAYGNDASFGNNEGTPGSYEGGDTASGGADDFKGLPRRVRQANLAPQLRGSSAAASPQASTVVPPATAASLTDMRNTLSAMQRGWQQGRSQTQRDTED